MDLYNETKFLMKKYNIYANKNLGQNFLVDDMAVETIVKEAEITNEDLVIEIGPGLGTLTSILLERAGKVVAIELDNRMIEILQDRFKLYSNFKIINNDVLKVDLHELIASEKKDNLKNVKIVANLPYYITTPIIMKLLEEKLDIKTITVMVQKEVADRLVETPGGANTGAITYSINYYTKPKKILQVPNTSFIPKPEVNSTVIMLEVLKEPEVKVNDEKLFFNIIKHTFMQKRKTLLNSLSNSNFYLDKKKTEDMLQYLNIDTRIRAEKLSINEFAKIANYIYERKG